MSQGQEQFSSTSICQDSALRTEHLEENVTCWVFVNGRLLNQVNQKACDSRQMSNIKRMEESHWVNRFIEALSINNWHELSQLRPRFFKKETQLFSSQIVSIGKQWSCKKALDLQGLQPNPKRKIAWHVGTTESCHFWHRLDAKAKRLNFKFKTAINEARNEQAV